MSHKLLRSMLNVFLLLAAACFLSSRPALAAPCQRVVSGDRPGLNGTTHAMAADGNTATGFQSSYQNWQYVQIDFSCVGDLSGVRRHMSRNGATGGHRGSQGEGLSYSVDGVTWKEVARADTTGWGGFVGYAPAAWHSVTYGWSPWLKLRTPVRARFLRFRWDGNADVVNEVEPFFYEPPPPDPLVGGLNALREASLATPYVRFERGVPRFVAAKVPIPASLPDDAVVQALDYLKRHRALYRIDDPLAQLYLSRKAAGETRHVFFGQHRDGIPVYGARLGVHLTKGHVVATNGSYLPALPELPPAAASGADAERVAVAGRAATGREVRVVGKPKLVYFNNGLLTGLSDTATGTRLAYHLVLEGRHSKSSVKTHWTYLVDAHDLSVLREKEAAAGDPPDKDFDIESGLGTDSDQENWFDADGPTDDYEGPPWEDQDQEGASAFNFTHAIYDYYFGNFHRHSYDGGEDQVEVTVDLVFGPSVAGFGAYYDTFSEVIYVQNGQLSLWLLGHEFTHGVTEHTACFEYENMSGALDESFADTFGSLISGNFGPLQGTPNHLLQAAPLSSNPECDQSDPNFNDCGNVHTNNAIPNNAAFLIINGGTLNGVTVPGVGAGKAQQLYYSVLSNWMHDSSNFRELRDAAVTEARGRTDFNAQDVCTVVNAFAAVGLGPLDANCDGVEDGSSPDLDGDTFIDVSDNCPSAPNPGQEDFEGDGQGDVCDTDDDNDTVADNVDNCARVPNPGQENSDGDARGDACDDDGDNDGVPDARDNCPAWPNVGQADNDRDGRGDACDTDDDNDGALDTTDNCRWVGNSNQADTDSDGVGNLCDNCPAVANTNQLDIDDDGLGDSCDPDIDDDGVLNADDNCERAYNPDQLDLDKNGRGIVCDPAEQRMYYGSTDLDFIRGLFRFRDIRLPIRIPIGPCLEDCPDWFPEDFLTRVDLELPFEAAVRVVDDRGDRIKSARPGLSKSFDFRVDADFYFRPPTGTLGGDAAPFSGRQYFLEITPPADAIPNHDYTIALRVRGGRPPFE